MVARLSDLQELALEEKKREKRLKIRTRTRHTSYLQSAVKGAGVRNGKAETEKWLENLESQPTISLSRCVPEVDQRMGIHRHPSPPSEEKGNIAGERERGRSEKRKEEERGN